MAIHAIQLPASLAVLRKISGDYGQLENCVLAVVKAVTIKVETGKMGNA